MPLGALIVVVLVAGVAAALTKDDDSYPAEWDERVADIAAFVEEERDLDFDHPVHIDFLSEDEFNELVTTDEADLTEEDRDEIEETAAIFRALGLIGADVDVLESVNELNESGILALYDPKTERVRVKGTELTPDLRVTLAHELTHALQDQHFDLKRLAPFEEETESLTFRGLIEGDATRVQTAFMETLDEDEAAEVEEANEEGLRKLDEAELPAVLTALLGAPYALGEPLATTLVEAEGEDALNDAIEDPPTSDEPLFDPLGYLAGDEPVDVDPPDLADGEEEVTSGVFGSIGWYVMLAQRIDAADALTAVDGWGGDRYVAYERDGTVCVRIAYVGDTAEDADELEDALDEWADAMPPGAATVEREGEKGLVLQSCDPGDDATVPDNVRSDELLVVPQTRSFFTALVLGQGGDEEQARCFADGIVQAFSVDELLAEEPDAEMERRITEVAARCR